MLILLYIQSDSVQSTGSENRQESMSLVQTASGGLIAGTGRDFFSNISSDLNGIAATTSSMFSDLFG